MDYEYMSNVLSQFYDRIYYEMDVFPHPKEDSYDLVRYLNLNNALMKLLEANRAIISLRVNDGL